MVYIILCESLESVGYFEFFHFWDHPLHWIFKESTFPFQFCFQNDQFSIIYQKILIFFLSDEWLQRKFTFYVFVYRSKYFLKKTLPPSLKKFMEIGGPKNYTYPPKYS